MSNTNLSALSMSELKAIAVELNAVPTSDKRSKQAWIDAIETVQACEFISDAEMESIAFAADMAAGVDPIDVWVSANDDNDVSMADYPASSEEHFGEEDTLIIDECADSADVSGCGIAAGQKNASSVFGIVICLAIALAEAISIVTVAAWSISKWATGATKHFAPAIVGILSAVAPQRQATNYVRVA